MTEENNFYNNYLKTFLQSEMGLGVNCLWIVEIDAPYIAKSNTDAFAKQLLYMSGDSFLGSGTQFVLDKAYKYFSGRGAGGDVSHLGSPFILATAMQLAGETITASAPDMGDAFGGLMSLVGGKRESNREFTVSMYLTDFSFPDMILKPWIRAMSQYGLKSAQWRSNIKCTLFTKKFTMSSSPTANKEFEVGTNEWMARLSYTYHGSFPKTMGVTEYNYNGADVIKAVSVGFGYEYYSISVGDDIDRAFYQNLIYNAAPHKDDGFRLSDTSILAKAVGAVANATNGVTSLLGSGFTQKMGITQAKNVVNKVLDIFNLNDQDKTIHTEIKEYYAKDGGVLKDTGKPGADRVKNSHLLGAGLDLVNTLVSNSLGLDNWDASTGGNAKVVDQSTRDYVKHGNSVQKVNQSSDTPNTIKLSAQKPDVKISTDETPLYVTPKSDDISSETDDTATQFENVDVSIPLNDYPKNVTSSAKTYKIDESDRPIANQLPSDSVRTSKNDVVSGGIHYKHVSTNMSDAILNFKKTQGKA